MSITEGGQDVPVKITGSSSFGRYPTVSPARTYNMFITSGDEGEEEWLVNFAGYEAIKTLLSGNVVGRGIFRSVRGGFVLCVIGPSVIRLNTVSGVTSIVGSLNTSSGEVVIDENLNSQICIVDGSVNAYIYNYNSVASPDFGTVTFSDAPASSVFIPNYVTYQNTFFVFGNGAQTTDGSTWRVYASGFDTGTPSTGQTLTYQIDLALQTKPDYAIAAVRIPSAGNNLLVLGTTVAEIWTQFGDIQTYTRQQSINIDYGCVSVSTIGASGNYVAWLGINEKSSPVIMVMAGGQATPISTDGIDYLMDTIQYPAQSTAFFFKQDGHLFYQLTFYNAADDLTLVYDFNTKKFFDLTDWDSSYHPARQVAYFENQIYFVSLKNGNLYQSSTDITTYTVSKGGTAYDIPRIRVCPTFRLPRSKKFRVNLFTFVIQSGTTPGVTGEEECEGYLISEVEESIIYSEDDIPLLAEGGFCTVYRPRVDVTISKNGGITYSNAVSYDMRNTAQYRCQPRFPRLGVCNQFGAQLRFWDMGRVVVHNGVIEVAS